METATPKTFQAEIYYALHHQTQKKECQFFLSLDLIQTMRVQLLQWKVLYLTPVLFYATHLAPSSLCADATAAFYYLRFEFFYFVFQYSLVEAFYFALQYFLFEFFCYSKHEYHQHFYPKMFFAFRLMLKFVQHRVSALHKNEYSFAYLSQPKYLEQAKKKQTIKKHMPKKSLVQLKNMFSLYCVLKFVA